ncbi:MAG: M48 family metallopeptidase [Roseomonas mucosa]|nr:M48 family metallopeptidase [Roseomonas mucosa]
MAWALSGLRVTLDLPGEFGLSCAWGSSRDGMRLLLSGDRAKALRDALRRDQGWTRQHRRRRVVAALGVLAACLVLPAFLFGGPVLADMAARLVPTATERSLADRILADHLSTPRCTQPQGQAALDGLVRRLAPDLANVEAMVLDGPAVNAYALPGGRIVLMRGLLDQAGDSAEVAGILAHELGHVSRNHAMRALARAMGLQLLTGYVTGYAGLSAPAAGAAVLSGSRGFEAEADAWAAAALERSGIGTGGWPSPGRCLLGGASGDLRIAPAGEPSRGTATGRAMGPGHPGPSGGDQAKLTLAFSPPWGGLPVAMAFT